MRPAVYLPTHQKQSKGDHMFEILIWGGATITLIGLALLMWCILRVAKARKLHSDDEEALRTAMQSVVPANLGALFLSAIGLMMVVIGVLFS